MTHEYHPLDTSDSDFDSDFDEYDKKACNQAKHIVIQEMRDKISYDIWHKPLVMPSPKTTRVPQVSTGLFTRLWTKLRIYTKVKKFARKCKEMKLL
jgi:hypothetical protein